MISRQQMWNLVAGGVVVCGVAAAAVISGNGPAAQAGEKAAAAPAPVEPDMHEFMEYVFEPPYKRLKAAMASEPADRRGWKPVKAEGLALAESANLLLFRAPEEGGDDWKKFSIAVRNSGSELYKAARATDFEAATKHYRAMLVQCNACHTQFAGGEHQLKP